MERRDFADRRSSKNMEADAQKANERARWMRFYQEFMRENPMGSAPEARAAFDRMKEKN